MGMRSENFYYIKTIQKVEIALGDMFNNIRVNKYSDVNRTQIIKSLKVPLVMSPNKNFSNWYENQLVKRQLLPLPIMGLRLNSITKNDSGRTTPVYLRQIFSKATNEWLRDIIPSPHFLNYTLHFLMDSRADLGQLVENILPYFNTDRYLRIYEFDWVPDLERKIQVFLVGNTINFQDEVESGSKHSFIEFKIDFRLEVELYRPLELAAMIKYAEINLDVDSIVGKHQALIYPTEIIEDGKQPFETTEITDVTGFSILKTICKTLVRQVDVDGNVTFEDVSAPECNRPTEVPDIKQLDLWFNVDSNNEPDHTPYHRDFTLLNTGSRTYVSDFPPSNVPGEPYNPNAENVVDSGYQSSTAWNRILTWFGSNDGLLQSPFTFKIKLQFNENDVSDVIFQQLSNTATQDIPEGKVFFDWGIMQKALYFSFATYGTKALNYTFKTTDLLNFNNLDVYEFIFAIYDEGRAGTFAYRINEGPYIALNSERIS